MPELNTRPLGSGQPPVGFLCFTRFKAVSAKPYDFIRSAVRLYPQNGMVIYGLYTGQYIYAVRVVWSVSLGILCLCVVCSFRVSVL